MYLVDADTPGLSINSFSTIDGSNCGDLHFEDVSTENTVVLLSGDDATQAIDKMLDLSYCAYVLKQLVGCSLLIQKQFNIQKRRAIWSTNIEFPSFTTSNGRDVYGN